MLNKDYIYIVIVAAIILFIGIDHYRLKYVFTSQKNEIGLDWEEMQHVEDGGSTQLAKMQDGTFIFLSVGLITAKVYTALKRQSASDFHEVKSFTILERKSISRFSEKELHELAQGVNEELNNQLHKENLIILERIRSLIKSPNTLQELVDTLMSSNCPVSI